MSGEMKYKTLCRMAVAVLVSIGLMFIPLGTCQTGIIRGRLLSDQHAEAHSNDGSNDDFTVLAYYAKDSPNDEASYKSLSAHAGRGAIDQVAAFNHPINAQGLIGGRPDKALMKLARGNGVKTLAVVHNFTGKGFSRDVAHSILSDANRRGAATGSIVWILKEYGYDGVNLDLENIDPKDRNNYTEFVEELASKMRGSGKLLAICVPAKTDDARWNAWSGAFDYKRLGSIADRVIVMAYDEHWVGGPPGPIASIEWVRSVIDYATKTIPRERILLGLANYAYDWPTAGGRATGTGRMIGERRAMEVAWSSRAKIVWDNRAQVPYFKYWRGSQEHTVYLENQYSAVFKINLAQTYGLKGVAVWRLGLEDPSLWGLLSK
jgi:spore germination protein